jgi:flagellar biogenesis protein FliO
MKKFFIRAIGLAILFCVLPAALAEVTGSITNSVASPVTELITYSATNSVASPVTNSITTLATNSFAPLITASSPGAGLSFVRVLGALVLVIGLFLGGVWLFKNWQRLAVQRGRAPKLNILETRSLGSRHAVFVVGYECERFLIASSPAGVNLLSHLPAAVETETAATETNPPAPSFAQALAQVLKRK